MIVDVARESRTRSDAKSSDSSTSSGLSSESESYGTTPPTSASSHSDKDGMEIGDTNVPTLQLFYQPPADKKSRELAILETVRAFFITSPAVLFTYWELFPQMTDHFLTLAWSDEGFWHTLLASAAVTHDMFRLQGPSELYLVEKGKSLQLIQSSISAEAIDEALVGAVFMQMFCEFCVSNLAMVRHHLNGLYLLFLRCQARQVDDSGSQAFLRPITRFLGRMCFRADITNAAILEVPPQWPEMTSQDEMEDRSWLLKLARVTTKLTPANIEWALASFEIDNLWQRTYRFAMQSNIYRKSGDARAEVKITREYEKLTRSFRLWKERSIVVKQDAIELFASGPSLSRDSSPRFLFHEPLYLQNPFYGKILNQWRSVWIYASTIVQPVPGPRADIPQRFQFAVDICRKHAALGKDSFNGPQWWCLFYAGLAFGKHYPLECHWIMERLGETARQFPVLGTPFMNMPAMWAADTVHWNAWGRLFPLPRVD